MTKLTFTAELFVNKSPTDEEISRLHREATANKNTGNWDEAITNLRKANDLMIHSGVSYGHERWLRLPLFLQQAGKMDEADEAFRWLLADVNRRVEKECEHLTANTRKAMQHTICAGIYDKWRLACKREKQPDKAKDYAALYEKEWALVQKYRELVDQERKKDLSEYHKKKSERKARSGVNEVPFEVEFINNSRTPKTRSIKTDSPPATNNRTIKATSSPQEVFETLLGFLILALIIWAIFHYFF